MEWGKTNGGVEIKSNFSIQVLAAFGGFQNLKHKNFLLFTEGFFVDLALNTKKLKSYF